MPERWLEIARRMPQQPWNRPHADKTWVLQAIWEQRRFLEEVPEELGVQDPACGFLRSKQACGRAKDLAFLRAFEARRLGKIGIQ